MGNCCSDTTKNDVDTPLLDNNKVEEMTNEIRSLQAREAELLQRSTNAENALGELQAKLKENETKTSAMQELQTKSVNAEKSLGELQISLKDIEVKLDTEQKVAKEQKSQHEAQMIKYADEIREVKEKSAAQLLEAQTAARAEAQKIAAETAALKQASENSQKELEKRVADAEKKFLEQNEKNALVESSLEKERVSSASLEAKIAKIQDDLKDSLKKKDDELKTLQQDLTDANHKVEQRAVAAEKKVADLEILLNAAEEKAKQADKKAKEADEKAKQADEKAKEAEKAAVASIAETATEE